MNLYRGYNSLSFPFHSNRFRFHWCSLMYVGMYFFSNERPTRQSLFTVTCIYTNYKHHKRIVIRFGGRGGERKKETIST